MKKSYLLMAVLAFGIVSFVSCRSSENCPAYGQVEVVADDAVNA